MKRFKKLFGQRLLFRQISGFKITRNTIRWCSLSTSFPHQKKLFVLACEKLLPPYRVEVHGQESQKGRRLLWAENNRTVPVGIRR